MRGKKIIAGVAVVFLAAFLSGCGKNKKGGEEKNAEMAKWQYGKNIDGQIKGTSGEEELKLGDLDKNQVTVDVAPGAFEKKAEISLANPDQVPDYVAKVMDPLGAPIEILADGDHARLDEKATVTFKFDPSALPQGPDDIYEVRVAYYDGSQWEYIKPLNVDKEKGEIVFETYHFSFLGATKVKDETKLIEDWAHSAALDKVMRDDINSKSDYVASQIIDMTLAKMGISDESTKGKILSDLLKSDSYREIYDEYDKGDMVAMNQKIALLAGEKIASNVPPSVFSEALGNVTGSADDIAAVSKAAGYAAEGQYKDAAKIIGEQIADKFLITTAGKIAVEMVDYQIQSWKNSEVEAAFKAYKNGADSVFFGYNVDPGDFDGVWLQMRGIRRQIELEAVRKENDARQEAGMPLLSEKQEEMLRASLKESYRKQFEERSKQEDKIEKIEADMKVLAEAFKKDNLFSSALGPAGLDKGYDFEQKLELLNKFAEKIMRDTNRFELSDQDVTLKEGAITAKSIALGARIYFSEPDGKKKYQEYLASNFGIDLYPQLKDLAGSWPDATLTITDVYIADELKNQPKDDSNGECDFSINPEDLIGKSNSFPMTISPSSDNSGMIIMGSGDSAKSVPFTYADGTIKAPFEEEGATGSLEINMSKTDSGFAADGTIVASYQEGKAKITASIKGTKGK